MKMKLCLIGYFCTILFALGGCANTTSSVSSSDAQVSTETIVVSSTSTESSSSSDIVTTTVYGKPAPEVIQETSPIQIDETIDTSNWVRTYVTVGGLDLSLLLPPDFTLDLDTLANGPDDRVHIICPEDSEYAKHFRITPENSAGILWFNAYEPYTKVTETEYDLADVGNAVRHYYGTDFSNYSFYAYKDNLFFITRPFFSAQIFNYNTGVLFSVFPQAEKTETDDAKIDLVALKIFEEIALSVEIV